MDLYSKTKLKAFRSDNARIEEIESEIATERNRMNKLEATVGAYGIRYNNITDTITRIGSSEGKVANANGGYNDFDNIMPWAGMRRCNLANDLTVNAYYGEAGYIEDGTNGQCMAEIPRFYFKREYVGVDIIDTYISTLPLAGFELHPWFYNEAGAEVQKKYFSTYEGSLFDVSASSYITDDSQIADFTATTGDKLCSIAGVKPCSGKTQQLTIVNSRIIANNRGTKWNQQYFNAVSAIQMLLIVEYASLDSQGVIGKGTVDIADTPNTDNNSLITGGTSILGNKSGSAAGANGKVSISYRGIENFWSNMWKLVDGINIQNTNAFVSSINGNFISDKFDGNYKLATALATVNGYASKMSLNSGFKHGFLPIATLGSLSSYYFDYLYQLGTGSFVAILGGRWSDGERAGAFYWSVDSASSLRARTIGTRLCV